ncbi:tetratricopeptide repeat protein [Synechocystis sp. B12]|nr:tetratricopeptide repeat protein [Synechocystis sp. B12]
MYFNRANVHGVLNNYQGAIDDCSQGILLDPQDVDLLICRGQAQLGLEQPRQPFPILTEP